MGPLKTRKERKRARARAIGRLKRSALLSNAVPLADSKTDTDPFTLLFDVFAQYVKIANHDLAHQWGLQQLHLAFKDKQINTLQSQVRDLSARLAHQTTLQPTVPPHTPQQVYHDNGSTINASNVSNCNVAYQPTAHQTMSPPTTTLHSTSRYDTSSIPPSPHYNGNTNGYQSFTSPSNVPNYNPNRQPTAHQSMPLRASTFDSTPQYGQSSILPSQHHNGNINGYQSFTSPSDVSNCNPNHQSIAQQTIPLSTPTIDSTPQYGQFATTPSKHLYDNAPSSGPNMSPPFNFNGATNLYHHDNADSTISSTLPTAMIQNNAYTHSASTTLHDNAPSSGPHKSPPLDNNGAVHPTPSTATKFPTLFTPTILNNASSSFASNSQHDIINGYQEHYENVNGDVDMTHRAIIRPFDTSTSLSKPPTTLVTPIAPLTSSTRQSRNNYKYVSRPHQGKVCTILFPPSV